MPQFLPIGLPRTVNPGAVPGFTQRTQLGSTLTLFQNTFEGGSDTTTITTGNSGGLSGRAASTTGGTPKFSATQAAHGSLSMAVTVVAASNQYLGWQSLGDRVQVFGRVNLWLPSVANAQVFILLRDSAGSNIAQIGWLTSGFLAAYNSAGTKIGTDGTVPIALSQWVRIEFRVLQSGTNGTQEIEWWLYNSVDSTTASDHVSNSAVSFSSTTKVNEFFIGEVGVASFANGTFYLDDIALGLTWPIGAVNPANTLISGTATGTSATSAAATGTATSHQYSSTADGTSATSATATGTATHHQYSSTAAGTSATSGTATGTATNHLVSGTATGTSASNATATGTATHHSYTSSASGTSATSASATGRATVEGTATGTSATSATATGTATHHSYTSTAAGTSATSASATGTATNHQYSSTATGTSATSATATGTTIDEGSAAGTSTTSGTATGTASSHQYSSAASGTSPTSGTATGTATSHDVTYTDAASGAVTIAGTITELAIYGDSPTGTLSDGGGGGTVIVQQTITGGGRGHVLSDTLSGYSYPPPLEPLETRHVSAPLGRIRFAGSIVEANGYDPSEDEELLALLSAL